MKKLALLLAVFCLIAGPAFAQIQLDLSSSKRPILMLNQDYPKLYKPTKLIVGKENKFLIKAEPKSFVSLLVSSANDGTAMFKGKKLRLGEDIQIIEGTIQDNGILELTFTLPDNKDLDEKVFYFEAVVSKDSSYSNTQIAKVMGSGGQETTNNSVTAFLPVKEKTGPSFAPTLPGAPMEMYRTMQMIDDMKNQAVNGQNPADTYKDDGLLYQSPLIRNLAAPELNNKIDTGEIILQIVLIPLDNRPVTYTLPVQIGELNKNIKVLVPPRTIIGGLTHNTNVDQLLTWLNDTLENNTVDSIVCSLDNIAYGGLIPSRRSPDTEAMILARLNGFKKIIQEYRKNHTVKLYAFSSIMRISNNNVNEEEKEYWNEYGELLFKFSYLTHKVEDVGFDNDKAELRGIREQIPQDILNDYLMTRKRNFEINKYYMGWIEECLLDYLVYSKDDTAEWGMNVIEARQLSWLINDKNLSSKITVQTGADEIPTDLLMRGIVENKQEKINIFPIFSTENGINVVSRYEDRTILESVFGQTALCGAKITGHIRESNMILMVHTPKDIQNDHAMKAYPEPENQEAISFFINIIIRADIPLILADVACANGADNLFINKLLDKGIDINAIYAYAGWNTTGNTLGSAISMGISRYLAETDSLDMNKFKKLLLTRLADDWAYQTIVRQEIRALAGEPDEAILQEELKPFMVNLAKKLDLPLSKIELSFPWNRTFEVEINL